MNPPHRADALRVVVVPVNRKDGQPDVDVFVFVIDSRPAVRAVACVDQSRFRSC
jgi:hypothetical protein